MPAVKLTTSLLRTTTTNPAVKSPIALRITPGRGKSISFSLLRNRRTLSCSFRDGLLTCWCNGEVGSGRTRSGGPAFSPGVKLGPMAHVKTPKATTARIKLLLPFRNSAFLPKPINYNHNSEKAGPCFPSSHSLPPLRSSASSSSPYSSSSSSFPPPPSPSSSESSSSSSGLVANHMGHESSRHEVSLCQNGDGGSPASLSSVKEKRENGEERFDNLNQSDEDKRRSKLLTLPTVLTLSRVAAIPLFVGTFYVNSWWGAAATTSIFIGAAITDWLDGYLARKMCLGTAFGAFLDPVADKLMVATTLVLLCSRPLDVPLFGNAPWLFVVPSIAIIGREITMSAVREWAASQNGKLSEAVAVNNLGKWKTATQMIALTILLACRDNSFDGPQVIVASGVVLLYISAWLAVWSLFVYMRKISKVLLR